MEKRLRIGVEREEVLIVFGNHSKVNTNHKQIVKNEKKLKTKVKQKVVKESGNGDQNGEKVNENHKPLNATEVDDLSEDEEHELEPQK